MNFASEVPIVIAGLVVVIVFLSLPIFFMIFAYSQIIILYKEMNRKRKKVNAAVHRAERKLLVKSIAITLSFFATYVVQLGIRVYECITKSDVSPLVDGIGTVGICLNTLVNSLVLLKFDGSVQSSALEMLGLEEWWRQKYLKSEKKSVKLKVIITPIPDMIEGNGMRDTMKEQVNPSSLATQKI